MIIPIAIGIIIKAY